MISGFAPGRRLILALALLAPAVVFQHVAAQRAAYRTLNDTFAPPHYTSADEWNRRAAYLREHVLASTGLLPMPERDFWEMSEIDREVAGVRPLPRSLDVALENLAASQAAPGWFGDRFFEVYLRFKRAELRVLDGLAASQVCARYVAVY